MGAASIDAVVLLAAVEAAELGADAVDVEHLLLAVVRSATEVGDALAALGVEARRVRDFIVFISGVNEARAAATEGRPYRRTTKLDPSPNPVTGVTSEARTALEQAEREARSAGVPVDARYLAVACAPILRNFGVVANDLRAALAIVQRPPVVVPRRELAAPARRGPLVLGGGGGERVASVIFERSGPPRRVVWAGLNPDKHGFARAQAEWAALGVSVIDSGLDTLADAHRADVCDTILSADVVLLPGGRPAALYATLTAGPAVESLISASDRGAVIATSSGSSHLLGSSAVDIYGDDGPAPEPTLGWLAGVAVSSHHTDRPESLDLLRSALWPNCDGAQILLIPHAGAVWVDSGWTTVQEVDAGEHGCGAHLWRHPAAIPERIQGVVHLPGPNE